MKKTIKLLLYTFTFIIHLLYTFITHLYNVFHFILDLQSIIYTYVCVCAAEWIRMRDSIVQTFRRLIDSDSIIRTLKRWISKIASFEYSSIRVHKYIAYKSMQNRTKGADYVN